MFWNQNARLNLNALLCRDEMACEYGAWSVLMSVYSSTVRDTNATLAQRAAGGQ
jgi:hypothetical protein